MEGRKRGLAAPEKIAQSSREGRGKEKRFNVMIMRGLGGVRSFNISPVFVFCVVLFFIAFTIASLFAINGFLHLRRWTAVQKREINQLRKKADHRLKELLEVKQRMALLTSYVRDLENPQKVKRVLVPEEKSVSRLAVPLPTAIASMPYLMQKFLTI